MITSRRWYQVMLVSSQTEDFPLFLHRPEQRGHKWTVRTYFDPSFGKLPSLKAAHSGLRSKIAEDYLNRGYGWEIAAVVDYGPKSPLEQLAEQAK
jgi:hypothetical protein